MGVHTFDIHTSRHDHIDMGPYHGEYHGEYHGKCHGEEGREEGRGRNIYSPMTVIHFLTVVAVIH